MGQYKYSDRPLSGLAEPLAVFLRGDPVVFAESAGKRAGIRISAGIADCVVGQTDVQLRHGVLCAEVNRKDARIRELEAEIAEREENCVANMRTVIKDHAEMNRFTRAQLAETERVNEMLRIRARELESLARSLFSTMNTLRLNGHAPTGRQLDHFEKRMAALGLLDGDAR